MHTENFGFLSGPFVVHAATDRKKLSKKGEQQLHLTHSRKSKLN